MTHYIELGGKTRPVRFGMAGLYEYEQRTGRKALADFGAYLKAVDAAREKALQELGVESITKEQENSIAGECLSFVFAVDLAFSGLSAGCRSEKLPLDFDAYDVADWMMADSESIGDVMQAFSESFPQNEGKTNGAPKAAKATPSRGGKN